jgi:hypothetical protein
VRPVRCDLGAAGVTLVAATDTWAIGLILLAAASFGQWAGGTRVGQTLSGPVCTLLVTAVLVRPPPSPPARSPPSHSAIRRHPVFELSTQRSCPKAQGENHSTDSIDGQHSVTCLERPRGWDR